MDSPRAYRIKVDCDGFWCWQSRAAWWPSWWPFWGRFHPVASAFPRPGISSLSIDEAREVALRAVRREAQREADLAAARARPPEIIVPFDASVGEDSDE